MNLLRVGGVTGEDSGDAVIESHTAGDQQVRLLNGLVNPSFAVHAHHAETELMRSRKGTETEERRSHGNLKAFGQSAKLIHGVGFHDTMAGEDDGPLGRENEMKGFGKSILLGGEHGMWTVRLGLGSGEIEIRHALLRILGDIHQDRTGAAGGCD